MKHVEDAVRRVAAWSRRPVAVRQLPGGVSNVNYVVAVDGAEFVVRMPGERTQLLGIDRANEAEAAGRAAALGIGPPVFGELPGVGTLITRLVPGHHVSADQFVERLPDVVALLRRFHDSGPIAGAFPIHRVVEWHARDAGAHGVIAPSSYERLHQASRRIERAFAAAPMSPIPCHNDLLPENVLFAADRVWLLDFEYAGMNDVFFDLANLSVNAGFTPATDEALLRLYFGDITTAAWARLQLMKIMSEFRTGMWAVAQQAISSLDTDFVTYANERLHNCERLAAVPQFETWLDDAKRPPIPAG